MLAELLARALPGSVAVIDIDGTIMDTAYRNRQILEAAAAHIPEIATTVAAWDWSTPLRDPLVQIAETSALSPARTDALRQFWEERFFSSPWLLYDRPYPGARAFLDWLRAQSLSIVYLTGRDEARMATGTRESFRLHGLPCDGDTRFLFKANAAQPDAGFKRNALTELAHRNPIALCVENEPENANIMHEVCPHATILLIETVTTENPARPHPAIHTFRRY
jgi:hypothetical protein